MRPPCLLTYILVALLDCGWSGLLYVTAPAFLMWPLPLGHSRALGLPLCSGPLLQACSRKDPKMTEKKEAQLCLLEDSVPQAWGSPWRVTCMRVLEACPEVRLSMPLAPHEASHKLPERSSVKPDLWLRGSPTCLAAKPCPTHLSFQPAASGGWVMGLLLGCKAPEGKHRIWIVLVRALCDLKSQP